MLTGLTLSELEKVIIAGRIGRECDRPEIEQAIAQLEILKARLTKILIEDF